MTPADPPPAAPPGDDGGEGEGEGAPAYVQEQARQLGGPVMRPPPRSLTYQEVVIRFRRYTEGNPARGFAPGYHFRIHIPGGADVGHINFRVGDSEHVRLAAGHIGFGVDEAYRGHRYAGKAARALAPFVARVMPEVIITANPDNTPSIRTILAIGGRFLEEIAVPPGDPHFARGEFRKRRYAWRPGELG